jgi:hypothetical protein
MLQLSSNSGLYWRFAAFPGANFSSPPSVEVNPLVHGKVSLGFWESETHASDVCGGVL